MKWIKIIYTFILALSGICTMCLFGILGICAINGIFNYLFTHCSELMRLTIGFSISLIGVVIGYVAFSDGTSKLKDNYGRNLHKNKNM